MNEDPRKPRWIMNPDGSIFHVDTRRPMCGLEAHDHARCIRVPGHAPGHEFRMQYPMPNDHTPYTPPKPSSLYPHDMDMPNPPPWRTHPDQLRFGSSRRMSMHTSADIQRSELHYLIDQLFDHAEDAGKPIDLGTLMLTGLLDERLGHHVIRISAVTKAPTAD